jgi:hypothetical protein
MAKAFTDQASRRTTTNSNLPRRPVVSRAVTKRAALPWSRGPNPGSVTPSQKSAMPDFPGECGRRNRATVTDVGIESVTIPLRNLRADAYTERFALTAAALLSRP